MAEKKEEGGRGWGDGSILFVALVILALFWFVNGGKQGLKKQALFVPSPLATTTSHQWLPFVTPEISGGAGAPAGQTALGYAQSTRQGQISISDYSGARATPPSEEYLTLYTNGAVGAAIEISGWQLHSTRTGRTATIGGGMETALMGQPGNPSPILLRAGDRAIISTGRSPVGISFKENMCTGYLAQFQSFTPSLIRSCPFPQNELASRPDLARDPLCAQAVAGILSCQTALSSASAPAACASFITERFTYNGCVNAHRGDQNFAGTQWRVFLGQDTELWSNTGDTILLLDAQGALVASVTY